MVSHKHKCVFIHIPKCAGTSVEKVLGHHDQFNGDSGAQDHRSLRMLISPNFTLRCLSSLENLAVYLRGFRFHNKRVANPNNQIRLSKENADNYFKFAIVRNPWSRAFSWYKNVIRDENHRKRHSVNEGTTFKEFLKVHAGKSMLRPQSYWLKDYKGNIPIDYIGKFEDLPSVFRRIQEELDLGDVSFPHEISGTGEDYRIHYDTESREIIERVYRDDIERFCYSFEE